MKIEQEQEMPVHYRYYTSWDEVEGFFIVEERLYPVRETEFCYFLVSEYIWNLKLRGVDISKYKTKKALKNSCRSHAYPDKKTALESFKIRKKKQILHCKNNAAIAESAINTIGKAKSFDELNTNRDGCCVKIKPSLTGNLAKMPELLENGCWYPVIDSSGNKDCGFWVGQLGIFQDASHNVVVRLSDALWVGSKIQFPK